MKHNIVHFLRAAFPFLAVVFLWRLSDPIWNPAGMLALIPIFYCSFVRPVRWFAPFAMLACFLIDYKFDTLCYWTALYCLLYAVNGFQSYIDLTRMDRNAFQAFAVFFGAALLILVATHISFSNIFKMIWLFVWAAALYIPITMLIKRADND